MKNFKSDNPDLTLILSLGPKGMLFAPKKNNIITFLCYPGYKINYIDYKKLVGVGDSALAGYIVALYQNKNETEAIKYSISTATARIMTKGNEKKFLDLEEVDKIHNDNNIVIFNYKYDDEKIKCPF